MSTRTSYTEAEWAAEARRRFGDDVMQWRFICPVCQHVPAVQEWKDEGVLGAAGFSCIGRWTGGREAFGGSDPSDRGPCDYAGGGLFALNPVDVDGTAMFDFAPATRKDES